MDLPVGLGDRLDAEQTVFAALGHDLWPSAAQAVTVDAAVDDNVGNVEAERPEFARHALRDHAQPRLGGRKLREACLAAQTTRRPREDHRAPPERRQSPYRLAPDQEPGKAADPSELLEELRWELAEIYPLVVTGVEDDKVGWLATAAGVHGAVKQPNHVDLARSVRQNRLGAAPSGGDRAHHRSILAGVRPATST